MIPSGGGKARWVLFAKNPPGGPDKDLKNAKGGKPGRPPGGLRRAGRCHFLLEHAENPSREGKPDLGNNGRSKNGKTGGRPSSDQIKSPDRGTTGGHGNRLTRVLDISAHRTDVKNMRRETAGKKPT